ncbi:TolC family protein [Sphingobacterium sp. HJSM2_6]|uniref:TolC family protein n=1 Tax=Sphingobacterium sp. HJSM2_6 TaxID=3366264 RepID=UPI003BDB3097
MKKIVLAITVFVCCLVYSVNGQDSLLSLTDCIGLAIKNNTGLLRNELALSRADIRYKQALNERLPSLGGNLSHGLSQGRSINPTTNQYVDENNSYGNQSLVLNAPIFNGFSILHQIRKQSNAREAGKLEYESAVNNLKLDVIEAFVKVLTAVDMLKQMESQLLVTKEQVQRHEVLNREGAISPGDYYDLKGQYSAELNSLVMTEQSLKDARIQLAGLLNIAESNLPGLSPIAISTDIPIFTADALYAQSLKIMPSMKALDWRIKELEQGIKVAKAAYFPSLSFGAGLYSNYSKVGGDYFNQMKNNLSKSISVGLNIPIFNKFNTRNQVKLAKLDLSEMQLTKQFEENELRKVTARSVFDLKIAQENIKNLKEQEGNYQEAFRIATVHFEAGNSNSVLYLTAKNKLDQVKSQLVIKRYEWVMQKYINDYYSGSLDL